ncbi:hypothetical protein I6F53_09665 [Pseudoalteromonas sp. SWN29]|uniref:hypothetical protein n=1 Tax=Pseudoalteromonas sp. SWN29 TaxID=2792064 RepID=UPI0018CFDE8D|nr:hypothetical protein [Pseudoalteromonas sp. SWN29]MBH0027255.1 hypothetical protein [Pseudoalteromonas sp. SWN29]
MPEVMSSNNIENHLREFVSSSDIEQYNSWLPTEVELENYNSELERKFKVEGYSTPLIIDVVNVGSTKANNLYIDITFPDSVLVYKNDRDFSEPNNPFPPDPIDKARALYQEKKEEALRRLNPLDSLHRTLSMNDNFSALSMAQHLGGNIQHITPINQNWWTRLNENKLTIKVNSLLHTREISFDDEYMIVPLTLGCHVIEAVIICEEYEDIKTQVIEMKV